MPKTIKIIVIAIGAAFVFCIGRCFYMVACISCTIPHIKDYKCAGTVNGFEIALKSLANNHRNITYKIRDTVGTKDVGFAYDIDINLTDSVNSFLYNIRCEGSPGGKLAVGLIGAFDLNHKKGGYGLKANGIEEVLRVFDTNILTPLSSEQHLKLQAL